MSEPNRTAASPSRLHGLMQRARKRATGSLNTPTGSIFWCVKYVLIWCHEFVVACNSMMAVRRSCKRGQAGE